MLLYFSNSRLNLNIDDKALINSTEGKLRISGGIIKYNIVVIKIFSINNGEEQWNITWDNGLDEYGYDVALDSLGNIYVAGGNGTLYPNFDFLLAKFNSSGGLVWKRTYDGGSYDGAWALTIDPQDMIYVVNKMEQNNQRVIKPGSPADSTAAPFRQPLCPFGFVAVFAGGYFPSDGLSNPKVSQHGIHGSHGLEGNENSRALI